MQKEESGEPDLSCAGFVLFKRAFCKMVIVIVVVATVAAAAAAIAVVIVETGSCYIV